MLNTFKETFKFIIEG